MSPMTAAVSGRSSTVQNGRSLGLRRQRRRVPDHPAVVIGRRLFDLTTGRNGQPAAGEYVFVVTHEPPKNQEHADMAPFTFVDGVDEAISAAREYAGDRIVDVSAGQIGGQALRLGLIDQVVVNLVPAVFGSGRPFLRDRPPSRPNSSRQSFLGRPRRLHDALPVRRREGLSVGPECAAFGRAAARVPRGRHR
jgi:dihydrofolate reductase